jgi:hypothetical protein
MFVSYRRAEKTLFIRRGLYVSSYLPEHFALLDLAPCTLPVAGLHWASPSASLDKNILLINNIMILSYYLKSGQVMNGEIFPKQKKDSMSSFFLKLASIIILFWEIASLSFTSPVISDSTASSDPEISTSKWLVWLAFFISPFEIFKGMSIFSALISKEKFDFLRKNPRCPLAFNSLINTSGKSLTASPLLMCLLSLLFIKKEL